MLNLTLQQLFGKNATQTDETLTIHKADLQGLTASTSNRGEQLLTALFLQAHQHFEGMLTDELGMVITDKLGRVITYDNRGLYEKLHFWFWKRHFNNQYQIDTFIADIFISPPTIYQANLTSNNLNY